MAFFVYSSSRCHFNEQSWIFLLGLGIRDFFFRENSVRLCDPWNLVSDGTKFCEIFCELYQVKFISRTSNSLQKILCFCFGREGGTGILTVKANFRRFLRFKLPGDSQSHSSNSVCYTKLLAKGNREMNGLGGYVDFAQKLRPLV